MCHLVPVPQSAEVPDTLRAYCGQEIHPGAADMLGAITGMPCEACLARSPIPAFALPRVLPPSTPALVGPEPGGEEPAAWRDLAFSPEQRIAVRFVLLLLLQTPTDRALLLRCKCRW